MKASVWANEDEDEVDLPEEIMGTLAGKNHTVRELTINCRIEDLDFLLCSQL